MSLSKSKISHANLGELPDGSNFKFAIVVSQWNKSITEKLFQGCYDVLLENNVSSKNILRIDVPGSFELIYGSKKAQEQGVNVVISIGSIIKGETKHFDFICNAVSQGIKDLNINSNVPVIFCVLTDNRFDQAEARSGGKHGNRGFDAAVAALKMASIAKL
ncbi:MAG: 6,7-dimethyl-8-ribityllumazine synthase [Bacteroidota bacterium]|nr:6,7-dimethyl-8-ribityllumazine synthase [Bacteroidota bacterium]